VLGAPCLDFDATDLRVNVALAVFGEIEEIGNRFEAFFLKVDICSKLAEAPDQVRIRSVSVMPENLGILLEGNLGE
jgi:hypothetical protein